MRGRGLEKDKLAEAPAIPPPVKGEMGWLGEKEIFKMAAFCKGSHLDFPGSGYQAARMGLLI